VPFERSSGILLHPTSLPSAGGIGNFGPEAFAFIEFLAAAKQKLWQVLPLGPTGAGNSPYSSTSAFAGNPLLISLELLAEKGLLDRNRLAALAAPGNRVDYPQVRATKFPLLCEAAKAFLQNAAAEDRSSFVRFLDDNRSWLDDFALFNVLRRLFGEKQWTAWPQALVRREPAALEEIKQEAADEIAVERVIQFFFFEQWGALHRACRERGIKIVGDVAIFVSHDSADVWTHPELYYLLPNGEPEFVAGVPPDAFAKTGQRWGNPLYRWDALRARGYSWWIDRMRAALRSCDIIRLDHFRGFEAYWEIPASQPTAVHGRWAPGPGDDLFHALRQALGELPFIVEDLGFITPQVHEMRDRLGFPGMKVMQFGFSDPGAHMYLPHRFHPNVVVYTGTHDNDTTRGWWQHVATPVEQENVNVYLGNSDSDIAWSFIRSASSSVANLCIFPLQDVLGLGSEARMNVPSHPDGNWEWRYVPGQLTAQAAEKLAALAVVTDRV
jgi:4-alpha-glucanotransferase